MPKLRSLQEPQVDERLLDGELDGDEGCQENGRHDGQIDDEGGLEPVVLVAFLKHRLKRRESYRHGDDAGPVALLQERELHGFPLQREARAMTMTRLGSVLTKKMVCQP